MPNGRPSFSRPHLWLIHLLGIIIPKSLRADWRQEWEAELRYREMLLSEWDRLTWPNKFYLMSRSTAAFRDALVLQPRRLEDQMFQDLRYGFRLLLKHKGFTAVAVLSLALGIGANTALFSVIDTVLVKTLPVQDPESLVLFEWESGRNFRTNGMRGTFVPGRPGMRGASVFRYDTIQALRKAQAESSSPLSHLFVFAPLYGLNAVTKDSAEIVRGQSVSGNYFAALGVEPMLGRAINDSDDKSDSPPVVVINHEYWTERFGARNDVIGEQVKLNEASFTIIGVTAPSFRGTLQVDQNPKVTIPLAFEPAVLGTNTALGREKRDPIWAVHMMGRLKPGASLAQARDSLESTFQAQALEIMPPPRKDNESVKIEAKDYPHLLAQSGSRGMLENRKTYAKTIYGLLTIVGVVLLIACANVANLLLARAALRGPEIGIRLAVGAGRLRLIRQLLTESLLLSLLGGIVGVVFAFWGRGLLVAMADEDTQFLPRNVPLTLSWRVLAVTFSVSLVTGILFGLAPAWRATRTDVSSGIKQSRRNTGAVSGLSKALVVAQVGLSLLLLLGAGLFIRTLYNLQRIDLGFNQENLLLFSVQPGQGGYKEDRLIQFHQSLLERLDAMPGVRAATFGRVPLIANYGWNTNLLLPGETAKSAASHIANRQMVRENYFSTLEIPLLAGRPFRATDSAGAPRVAIVNQTFGKEFFPNEEVIGKRVKDGDDGTEMEIIGVVRDTKYNSQRSKLEPLVYTNWLQEVDAIGEMYFSLRTVGDPSVLTAGVRQIVRDLDPNLPVTEVGTQLIRSAKTLGQERLQARLLSFFAVLALLLAGIGMSGVLAYSVTQRTNEIGVRMALGAQPGNVLRMVIWQGMRLVLIGLGVGALCAYGLKRLLGSTYFDRRAWQRQMADQLYEVNGVDPWLLGAIALVLFVVALTACWLPARRAARVDPLVALRYE